MLRFDRVHEEPLPCAQAVRATRLRLTYDERAKSRLVTMVQEGPNQGTAVAITLPRGTVMRDGMILAGDDGVFAIIEAAPQPAARISADSPVLLLRAVYHLANRHVAAQLAADHALIERDPVLERMLAALGARVEHVELPFDPEAGAYSDSHPHPPADAVDEISATLGEQLSIEAHRTSSSRAGADRAE